MIKLRITLLSDNVITNCLIYLISIPENTHYPEI